MMIGGKAEGTSAFRKAAGSRCIRLFRAPAAHLVLTVLVLAVLLSVAMMAVGCGDDESADEGGLKVVATTSVLADIAQQVAGDRFDVEALIPSGTDPHAFEPTPADVKRLVSADLVIMNGAGLEATLEKYLEDVDADRIVVASEGLDSRTPAPGEPGHDHAHEGDDHAHDDEHAEEHEGDDAHDDEHAEEHEGDDAHEHEGESDPHFWLDPILVQTYVDTIAAAFEKRDPDGADAYAANAEAFDGELTELDERIREAVAAVPEERRKLVMNHASHGYWADRYGFDVVGAVIPSVSTGSVPTAQDLAELLATIEREDVPAVFVQVGENPKLADQIAADAGVVVVDDLYTGSLSEPDGDAPTYIDLMDYNTQRIVDALR